MGVTHMVILHIGNLPNFLLWWNGKMSLDQALPDLSPEQEELLLTGRTLDELEIDD